MRPTWLRSMRDTGPVADSVTVVEAVLMASVMLAALALTALVLPPRRLADPEPVARCAVASQLLVAAACGSCHDSADNTLHLFGYGGTMASMARDAWTDERLDDLKRDGCRLREMRTEFRAIAEMSRVGRAREMREEIRLAAGS